MHQLFSAFTKALSRLLQNSWPSVCIPMFFAKKLHKSIFGFHRLLWKLRILTLLEHLSLGKVWACLSTRSSHHHVWMQLALWGVTKLKNKLQVYLSIAMKLLQIWSVFHCRTCMAIQQTRGITRHKTSGSGWSAPELAFSQGLTRTSWQLTRKISELWD